MAILPIKIYPDPILLKPAEPVSEINDDLQKIIEDMAETMYDAPGVGLAANQAGYDLRIVVYDANSGDEKGSYQALINPVIIESQGSTISEEEGCLSLPDLRCDINRAERVLVEALDRDGKPMRIEACGLAAIILQHEIDHLNGLLLLDKISSLKRQIYKRKRHKLIKNE